MHATRNKRAPNEPKVKVQVNNPPTEKPLSYGFAEAPPEVVLTIWSGVSNPGSCHHGSYCAYRITTCDGRKKEKFCVALGLGGDELLIEGATNAFQALQRPCVVTLRCDRVGFAEALIAHLNPVDNPELGDEEKFRWLRTAGWFELLSSAGVHEVRWMPEPIGRLVDPHDPLNSVARIAAFEIDPNLSGCPFC